jgi:hypothetical protein
MTTKRHVKSREGNGLRTYLSSVLKFAGMIVQYKIRMPSPAVRGVTLLGPRQTMLRVSTAALRRLEALRAMLSFHPTRQPSQTEMPLSGRCVQHTQIGQLGTKPFPPLKIFEYLGVPSTFAETYVPTFSSPCNSGRISEIT